MGWLFLLLTTFGFAFMTLCSRLATKRGGDPFGFSFFLVVGASIFSFVAMLATGHMYISKEIITIGIIGGVGGIIAVVALSKALQIGHYGFSVSILSASFVLLVIYSVLVWKEPVMLEGIVIILVSIFLMATSEKKEGESKAVWGKWVLIMLVCFSTNGFALISQGYASLQPKEENFAFLFMSYLSSALFLVPFVIKGRKEKFTKTNLIFGFLAAAGSMTGIFATLKACTYLDKNIVFPVYFSAFNIAGLLLSVFFFKDKVNLKGLIGVALGILGVLVVSFKWTLF